MTYLLLRLSSLGDVAMTVPVIESLSRLQPQDRFIVVTRSARLLHGLQNVEVKGEDMAHGCRPDVVIDLQNDRHTWLLDCRFRLAGIPVFRVRRTPCWTPLTIHSLTHSFIHSLTHSFINSLSAFRRYSEVCRRAGLQTDDSFTALPVNEAARQQAERLFGPHAGHWIGIAPFAKSRSNMLPYRVTKELIQHYSAQPDTRVFLFGGGKVESEMLRQWAGLYPNVVSVAGQLPIETELELMRQLEMMICMDSANQHLCSLVGLRAVSIWCATHPALGFYGWKQRPEDAVQCEQLSCRPCTLHGRNYCPLGNFACKKISVEKILEKTILYG